MEMQAAIPTHCAGLAGHPDFITHTNGDHPVLHQSHQNPTAAKKCDVQAWKTRQNPTIPDTFRKMASPSPSSYKQQLLYAFVTSLVTNWGAGCHETVTKCHQ